MEESAEPSPNAAVGHDDRPVAGSTAAAASASGAAASSTIADSTAERAEDILGSIRMLKEQQCQMRVARKAVSKQLRNQSKRVSRIRKRARLLSDGDLVALLKMRHDKPLPEGGGGLSASSGCHPSP